MKSLIYLVLQLPIAAVSLACLPDNNSNKVLRDMCLTNIYTESDVRIHRLILSFLHICQREPGSWEGAGRWSGNTVEKCSQELAIWT